MAALLASVLASQPTAVQAAELRSFLTVRRALGLGFLGGALLLTRQGLDYRRQANDLYDLYKASNDPTEASSLYQRTTNRDVKSQVSLALAAACAVSGVRLILTRDSAAVPQSRPAAVRDKPGLNMDVRLDSRRFGLGVNKRF